MSLLEVKCLITDCNVGPLALERIGEPTLNEWNSYVNPTASNLTLNPVAAHSANGRDLVQVPEAYRTQEVTQFYTQVRLYVADEGFTDIITYRGRKWLITNVHDYELQGEVYIAYGVLRKVQLDA